MKWALEKLFSQYRCLVFYRYSISIWLHLPLQCNNTCAFVPCTECPANPWSFSCSCSIVHFIKLGQRIQEVASWYEYYHICRYSCKSRGETFLLSFWLMCKWKDKICQIYNIFQQLLFSLEYRLHVSEVFCLICRTFQQLVFLDGRYICWMW